MIKVLRDFVAVEKEKDSEKKSGGGLILVDLGDNKHVAAVVVAVGSGHVSNGVSVPLEVKVGDKITFNRTLATEVKDDEKVYWVLREDSVLAVLS